MQTLQIIKVVTFSLSYYAVHHLFVSMKKAKLKLKLQMYDSPKNI